MVEYPVKDYPDALFCGGAAELSEVLVSAEQRVNIPVVGGIVSVVGIGLRYRIEVYDRNAEIRKISQPLLYAGEVSSEEVVVLYHSVFISSVRPSSPVAPQDIVLVYLRRFITSAFRETVGEYLIHNPLSQPLWD